MMHSPQLPQFPPVSQQSPTHNMQPKKVSTPAHSPRLFLRYRDNKWFIIGVKLLILLFISVSMQQRPPGNQVVLKEEKLSPSPVMRTEPFNPAMRPDHHKHTDTKLSQPGHGHQSENPAFPLN